MNQQFGLSDFGRQGMGQDINALGSLGSVNQAYNQALLTADQQQAQTGAYEPYGRLNQYGNMLTGLSGGVAGQQYQDQQQSDPYASALAGATGVAGLFGQIYGGRRRLIMKTLNRPMFRYGGPIKEGVMHGIREPRRDGGSMGNDEGQKSSAL